MIWDVSTIAVQQPWMKKKKKRKQNYSMISKRHITKYTDQIDTNLLSFEKQY